MQELEAKTLVILGRQPAFGLAELESLYGAEHLQPLDGAALLDIPAEQINFNHLGGTIKVAKLLANLPMARWSNVYKYLAENIPKHLQYLPEGTFTLGMSVYGLDLTPSKLNGDMLSLKKIIRNAGRSTRVVPNKTLELNSAQVLHNKLTYKGAWELIAFKNGSRTLLAQTMFIQDIEAYGARDQARPHRDTRVGMLPPKLAQIIINLAAPTVANSKQRVARILDPFCGTGVILQEAMLMGYHVMGTDIDERMVEFSQKNIQWLVKKYPRLETQVVIERADATMHQWPRFTAIASEVFLGRPLAKLPDDAKLKTIIQDANTIIKKFLQNLAPQLKHGQRLALAVPAWKTETGFLHLPLLENLKGLGYNRIDFVHAKNDDLVYFREGQIVARELLILEKA